MIATEQQKSKKESISVLEECVGLQERKSLDYQNPMSRIRQADHYPNGVQTITDMAYQKLIRAYSLLDTIRDNPAAEPQFENLEDSYIDAINYLSFAVSYIRGAMDGQDITERDIFNRLIVRD